MPKGILWSSDETIASHPSVIKLVLKRIMAQLEEYQWPLQDKFGFHLAAEEALVNAIRHGNKDDSRKKVHISCTLTRKKIVLTVTDEGQGFNPAAVPDCTAPENLERPSGRGVMLMRHYMDRVDYNDRGNQVRMVKIKTSRPTVSDVAS